uniref:SDR family oxidoreductase n=1 Tax=Virgibacillus salexigens TaxID=61016 RepID=UPI00190CFD72
LITGASKGQGESQVNKFLSLGARDVIASRKLQDANELSQEAEGKQTLPVQLDVTSEEDWEQAIQSTIAVFGRLVVLVNNAGLYYNGPLTDTELNHYREIINVNQI